MGFFLYIHDNLCSGNEAKLHRLFFNFFIDARYMIKKAVEQKANWSRKPHCTKPTFAEYAGSHAILNFHACSFLAPSVDVHGISLEEVLGGH